jgi:hypothetical protein
VARKEIQPQINRIDADKDEENPDCDKHAGGMAANWQSFSSSAFIPFICGWLYP